jgi:predicted HNH restriction endonuclease
MRRIFLAPRSNETAYKNYMSSMQGKPLDDFLPYLSDEEVLELRGNERYFVWGCQPSLRARWEKMELGDYVFFYAQGRFISVGRLKFKKYSEDLALSLWPKSADSGEPWSCVFFVEDVQEINLPLSEFNDITGYSLKALQGFMQISSEEAVNRIIAKYGSTDGFVVSLTSGLDDRAISEVISIATKSSSDVTVEDKAKLDSLTRDRTPEEIERLVRSYAERQQGKTPEQIEKLTKSYRRNVGMVKILKEKYQNKCQICGFTFKTSKGTFYSEAAHIIPISEATSGIDSPDNIWILCANHHKMLDRGAIEAINKSSYRQGGVVHRLMEI